MGILESVIQNRGTLLQNCNINQREMSKRREKRETNYLDLLVYLLLETALSAWFDPD
jgi:hypothetical protein